MIVNIDVPDEVYERASDIARLQRMSISEVFATACAEHVDAWRRLEDRRRKGDRARFLAVLDRVPDVEPEPQDRL